MKSRHVARRLRAPTWCAYVWVWYVSVHARDGTTRFSRPAFVPVYLFLHPLARLVARIAVVPRMASRLVSSSRPGQ